MDRYLKAYLYDINVAINEVYSFFEQVPKRFDEYLNNLMLRRAIERNSTLHWRFACAEHTHLCKKGPICNPG